MSPFDITDIRRIIFGYIYPLKITTGMMIQVVKTAYHPFLAGRTGPIHKIIRRNHHYVIVLVNEQTRPESQWYKVNTYLYPNQGDIIKVIQYFCVCVSDCI